MKSIRDKAAALAAYARQRKNVEMERWVAEIKLRAEVRIGELSRKLEISPQAKGGRHASAGKPSKTEALKAAGISTSGAHRAELLAENAKDAQKCRNFRCICQALRKTSIYPSEGLRVGHRQEESAAQAGEGVAATLYRLVEKMTRAHSLHRLTLTTHRGGADFLVHRCRCGF